MPQTLRIFLASPWDTQPARDVVAEVVAQINGDALTRDELQIDLLRWDDPNQPVPCSFLHNPQADVVATTGHPGDCDLVIGLFRHVFGSPLPERDYGLSTGGKAWTGTEWEIHRAVEAARQGHVRDVLLFKDTTPPTLPTNRQARSQVCAQYERVCDFFEACTEATTATILRGINEHDGLTDFRDRFEKRLKEWLKTHRTPPAGNTTPAALPTPASASFSTSSCTTTRRSTARW